jgi:dienelactone hydrolase
VLVCPEWWGLNDYPKSRAEQLAKLGYIAFALDMYGKGVKTEDAGEAGKLAGALYKDSKLLRERASAGLKVLTDQPNVDASKVAAIGYCFGGKVALELARSGADLAAVVSFHGALSTDAPAKGALKPRILICNGADDTFIKPEDRAAFLKEMKDAKADYVFIDYAGAVHAFTNPTADSHNIPGIKYNQAADRRSWQHMMDLLAEVFGTVGAGGPATR